MKVYLDNGAFLPTRSHPMDAGLDLKTPYTFHLESNETKVIETGVHIKLPYDTAGLVTGKSALMSQGIFCQVGTIDATYRGSLYVILHNTSKEQRFFEVGDKIAQLVIVDCKIVDVEQVFALGEMGH